MRALEKNWDRHVIAAEEVARGQGFQHLRDTILRQAEPELRDRVVDVGSGTGLLTLPLAEQVSQVWAVDISTGMGEYLRAKATSARVRNISPIVASAVSLPLVDGCADLVVSNYCFHHLRDADKRRALGEVHRVLAPGGRLVLGDMMFQIAFTNSRDRQVVSSKAKAMLKKGPGGVLRLARNAARVATGSWEKPARPEWWDCALRDAGFVDVRVEVLPHEGGVATARKPA